MLKRNPMRRKKYSVVINVIESFAVKPSWRNTVCCMLRPEKRFTVPMSSVLAGSISNLTSANIFAASTRVRYLFFLMKLTNHNSVFCNISRDWPITSLYSQVRSICVPRVAAPPSSPPSRSCWSIWRQFIRTRRSRSRNPGRLREGGRTRDRSRHRWLLCWLVLIVLEPSLF